MSSDATTGRAGAGRAAMGTYWALTCRLTHSACVLALDEAAEQEVKGAWDGQC
jgi:hypothetical protein